MRGWYWQRKLRRFVEAQANGVYEQAISELREGHKTGHWIWFVFPQEKGLGLSMTSDFYGIGSMAEARAYLRHPVLGPRLVEATSAVIGSTEVDGKTLEWVMGSDIDARKFRSSMSLFTTAARQIEDPNWWLFDKASRISTPVFPKFLESR